MASNSFGSLFKITTWGESHGKAIGVVIDGCPAGLSIHENEINEALALRAPGKNPYMSPRKESDKVEILSGVHEGITTGAPISLLIPNTNINSNHYHAIKDLLRPGHANFTYLQKYGIFDHRGGGRSSARETACRVAAGAIASKFIAQKGINIVAYIKQIGKVVSNPDTNDINLIDALAFESPLFCPDKEAETQMISEIESAKHEGDSLGGIVEFIATSVPVGLGDPIYEKLEAKLAHAMMSLPATKGFEIGSGFSCVTMRGSEHNDPFMNQHGRILTKSNYAGGTLGGISNGMPIIGRVAFKPTSSIMKPQKTLELSGQEASLQLPSGSRNDPCVAIRAVPIVKAMLALVLADLLLLDRSSKV